VPLPASWLNWRERGQGPVAAQGCWKLAGEDRSEIGSTAGSLRAGAKQEPGSTGRAKATGGAGGSSRWCSAGARRTLAARGWRRVSGLQGRGLVMGRAMSAPVGGAAGRCSRSAAGLLGGANLRSGRRALRQAGGLLIVALASRAADHSKAGCPKGVSGRQDGSRRGFETSGKP